MTNSIKVTETNIHGLTRSEAMEMARKFNKQAWKQVQEFAAQHGHWWYWTLVPRNDEGEVLDCTPMEILVAEPAALKHEIDSGYPMAGGCTLFQALTKDGYRHETGTGRVKVLIRPSGEFILEIRRPSGTCLRYEERGRELHSWADNSRVEVRHLQTAQECLDVLGYKPWNPPTKPVFPADPSEWTAEHSETMAAYCDGYLMSSAPWLGRELVVEVLSRPAQ